MGFENMYGIGRGEAQVFNFGNVVNTYAQQLALDAQKRQKEREVYAKELESISWEGARPADEDHFRTSWEKVLDLNHKRSTTDKKEERIALSSQIATMKKQMLADAKRSVMENATDADIAKMPLNKDIDELPDQFGELLKSRRAVSTFNPTFTNYGTDKFMVQPKPYDLNADILNTANIAATEVNQEYTIGSGIDARRGYKEGKLLDENKFKEMILARIATNPAAKRAYLQGNEPTPENLELAATAAYEAVKDKFALKNREGGYIDPSGREMTLYRQKAAISDSYEDKKDDKQDDLIYRQKLISRVFSGDTQALNEVKAYLPSGSEFKVITSSKTKDSKGGYKLAQLKIPAGEYNGNYLPAIKEDISFSLGDPMNRLNAIISQYTGERIQPSKLNTVGGKPRGETYRVNPTQTRSGTPAKPTKKVIKGF